MRCSIYPGGDRVVVCIRCAPAKRSLCANLTGRANEGARAARGIDAMPVLSRDRPANQQCQMSKMPHGDCRTVASKTRLSFWDNAVAGERFR